MAIDQESSLKLAVLIDADNASPRISKGLFKEIAAIGEASVRRIYGDFSGAQLKGWAEVLSAHAIMPHQNFAHTAGKNSSDITLVIDAMDLLHTGRFDGFCLVSSDSDFTRLAARIREQGLDVYGFGEQKTPESFRKACKRHLHGEFSAAPAGAGQRAARKALLASDRYSGNQATSRCCRSFDKNYSCPDGRSEWLVFSGHGRQQAPRSYARLRCENIWMRQASILDREIPSI